MAVAACPTPETLAAFARGDLAAEELSAVAAHVGVCEVCCGALKLVPEDSLVHLARAAAAVPPTVQSVAAGSAPAAAPTAEPEGIPAALANHPRYRIIGELGRGGMGVVYKAEHRLMGRVVALKVVAPHLTAKPGAVERFAKEFKAAGKLHHHNIVTYYDAEEAGGLHFLAMEFVEGVSLDRLVAKKGPLPVNMACAFARQAALGLQHAAEKGMVHRDIKPQNLMVTRKGQVKILDFGLARFASSEGEPAQPAGRLPFGAAKQQANIGVTNPNLLMGTPDYLSPEQAKNSHDVDPRSDVYSLGCTLYFLLTGKPPFIGASTLLDKLLAHTHDEPPPVREARPEVPEGLAEVLAKMMAKKPEERYQTAAEAAAALHPFTRSNATEPAFEIVEAVVVAPAPVMVPVPVAAPVEPLAFDTDPVRNGPTLAELAKPKKRKKKRSWWRRRKWALLGGAAALALLIAVALAANRDKTPTDKPNDPNAGASAKGNTPGSQPGASLGKGKEKSNPWLPGTVVAPPKGGAKVLFVLPSSGVWLDDYAPVRRQLEKNGVGVETASTDGGTSKPHGDTQGEPVPIDKFLRADMDLSDYSAVVFTGFSSDEYMFLGKGSFAAKKVIERMHKDGKVVGAICVGQGVLAAHGVLKGKKAARCERLLRKHPLITDEKSGIDWQGQGVVTDRGDGKVAVTAARPEDAVPFAEAILKAIDGK